MKKKCMILLGALSLASSTFAQTWIWYPGDYEIWSNKHFFRFGKIQLLAELYDYIMTVRFPKRRKKSTTKKK